MLFYDLNLKFVEFYWNEGNDITGIYFILNYINDYMFYWYIVSKCVLI